MRGSDASIPRNSSAGGQEVDLDALEETRMQLVLLGTVSGSREDARAIIRDVNKQLDQDKVIWDRMRFEPNPVICDGDGPIPQFRQWYSRYYAKPTGEGDQGGLRAVG